MLHTADWQLGLKLRFIPGDRGARARLERFETVRRIARLARQRQVDGVVVAGDIFDDNAVGPATLQAARDALGDFSPVPVFLLPGNHDAAKPGGALERLAPERHGLDHVRTLLTTTAVPLGTDARLYPCPLVQRQSATDPTAHLPQRRDGDGIRIAVAHGTVQDFEEHRRSPNLIDAQAVIAKGFDYLALGDWHGARRWSSRVWYAGTHEATRFRERDPGQVLLVEIDRPGDEPRVEAVPVARTRWVQHAATLEGTADVEALARWLGDLSEASWTLVSLELQGLLSLAQQAHLDSVLEARRGELLHLRVDDSGLEIGETGFDDLPLEGFVERAAQALWSAADRQSLDALRLLHRLLREVEG